MANKKSQQISINFLVKFILAIVIFGLGVGLMWNIYFDSRDTLDISQNEFDQRIAALNCKPTEIVCISSSKFDIEAGDDVIMDLKINNFIDSDFTYDIDIEIINSAGTTIHGPGASAAQYLSVRPGQLNDVLVPAKDGETVSFMIATTKSMPKGAYDARIVIKPKTNPTLASIKKRIPFEVN